MTYFETDYDLLARAQESHDGLQNFREDRERCKRFTYGDQWDDLVEDRGALIRESELILRQGNMPLKNNLIRRLVRNVLGVYRNRWNPPRCSMADPVEEARINRLLEENQQINRMEELYARTMEEFLIGGVAAHKKWYGRRGRLLACHTDMVSPGTLFFETSPTDFRGFDTSLVGERHSLSADELIAAMARTPREAEEIRRLYGIAGSGMERTPLLLWEVWERHRPLRPCRRDRKKGTFSWGVVEEWEYSFITPSGHVLRRGLSPYAHGSHPYILKAYPFVDGEIHSFVADVIDQQKLTNRLVSMYDWILRASAKGVLLFPEGSLPEGADFNDVVEEWSRFNGVIVYRPRAGVPLPQQVSSKTSDIGITELLEIQMKMMEDISGVNGALQGKLDSNSMSGTLYDQQTRNSLTSLADLMKTFDDFTSQATCMDVSNLTQYSCVK